MIPRIYDNLEPRLKKNKVLVILGPRRSGKTTLLKNLLKKTKLKYKLDSGDNLSVQDILKSQRFESILPYLSGYQLFALDEAQHVPNIGMALKIIVDQIPEIKVIVTGSSTLDLRGQLGEPLVGRKIDLHLFPISQMELMKNYNQYELKNNLLPQILIYGSYPEVMTAKNMGEKKELIEQITNTYLLKDILEFERVKDSKTIRDLLKLLSFQVGQE
ncbi:AAA family ATPase, partial [Candidatus Roizmanbacteria bacterium]|nr:AAA family ATPase [Candidatus Roizmanbacteria bacterium]